MDIVGINFSDRSIEAVQASSSWLGTGKLTGFGRIDVPAGVITNGKIDDADQLRDRVQQLYAEAKPSPINAQHVAFSIPESQIFSRVLSFPAQISVTDIEHSLQYQLPSYVPFEIDAMYYDSIQLGTHDGQQEVLTVAIARDILDAYAQMFQELHLHVDTIELESISSARAVMELPPESTLRLLLDVGARTTIVSIFSHTGLRFTFNIPVAGDAFTEQIAKSVGVTDHQAEKLKLQSGLTGTGKQAVAGDVLRAAWQPVIDKMTEAIEYVETKTHANLDAVIIIGGSGQLIGLADHLTEQLGVTCQLGTLLPIFKQNSILQSIMTQQLMYANALGLAAGSFIKTKNQTPYINFFRNKT